jgi:hypothetical protein
MILSNSVLILLLENAVFCHASAYPSIFRYLALLLSHRTLLLKRRIFSCLYAPGAAAVLLCTLLSPEASGS